MRSTILTLASAVLAICAFPAAAQYRQGAMRPPMDEAQILAQGTAVQVPLALISDPKHMVAKAAVEDKDGHSVGSVNSVVTDDAGRPNAVKVNIGGVLGVGKKVVSLNARALLFEQDRDLLIAPLTQDEIKALPASGS